MEINIININIDEIKVWINEYIKMITTTNSKNDKNKNTLQEKTK